MEQPCPVALRMPGKWRHWSMTRTETDIGSHDTHELAIKTRAIYIHQWRWSVSTCFRTYSLLCFDEFGSISNFQDINIQRPISQEWNHAFYLPASIKKTLAVELGDLDQEARYKCTSLLYSHTGINRDAAEIIYCFLSDLVDLIVGVSRKK